MNKEKVKKELIHIGICIGIILLLLILLVLFAKSLPPMMGKSKDCIDNHIKHDNYNRLVFVITIIKVIGYLIVLGFMINKVLKANDKIGIKILRIIKYFLVYLIISVASVLVIDFFSILPRYDSSYWWCQEKDKDIVIRQ